MSDSSDDEKTGNQIQKMIAEMHKIKEEDNKKKAQIQYRRNKKNIKQNEDELKSALPPPKTKQEIYQEMKQQQKNSWKAPGYTNQEFSKVPVLRGKVLTEWEYERIFLSERSYKAPEGYKGYKIPAHGKEFGDTGLETFPPSYQEYLKQFKEKFEDFQFRPTKYGKIELDEKLDKFQQMNKEPFKLTNSVQSNNFGFDKHSTWECEISQKMQKTKNSTKK